jgi:rSAM/selenodomain-associated transferase 2
MPAESGMDYSVIIPTWNEEDQIIRTVCSVRSLNPEAQIVVADGGSTDDTVARARELGAEIVLSQRGRGLQCNAGACCARGNLLMFLHADTVLADDAFDVLSKTFQEDHVQVGTFRLRFDHNHWMLRFYEVFTRFDSLFTRFGDQCIVVRKSFFDTIGGFPDWPLFEDVHFLRMARRQADIVSFPTEVTTSARRFLKLGIIRTQMINIRLFSGYLLGVSPEKLRRTYECAKQK